MNAKGDLQYFAVAHPYLNSLINMDTNNDPFMSRNYYFNHETKIIW
jgi:hypothetical protein